MRPSLPCTLLGLASLALVACGGAATGNTGGGSGSTGSHAGTGGSTPTPSRVDKIDIVLGIDNTRTMVDKQELFSLALPDLIGALTNPPCLDANGQLVPGQPATALDACPAGSAREFAPILDLHIGVVTTSLGGFGSDACPDQEKFSCAGGAVNTSNNDHGHLVTRQDPCMTGDVPTYESEGFLAWDPAGKDMPPGESSSANLATNVKDLVLGTGNIGCGFESQLESWYRFLVDPSPYEALSVGTNGLLSLTGTDQVLLVQRQQFLRPDSLLAILILSDGNDCSTKEYGQFYLAAQLGEPSNPNMAFHLPSPRSECVVNPNDPCCASCAQPTPAGCPADPACTTSPTTDDQTDNVNLRCWDQKRRFGIDFLYPTDRYVTGLTAPMVPDRSGNMQANPIFTNLDPVAYKGATVRDPGLVVLAAIIGVPWQDLARDPADLTQGYKSAEELALATNGITTWDVILGDPTKLQKPLDPHMIESDAPRMGTNPITGDVITPPSMTEGGPDKISGHEYTPGTVMGVQASPDDLEFACIFPIQTPLDCTDQSLPYCDCTDPLNDQPICATNGNSGRTLQTHAKAYPGLRQLTVLRDLGPQGVAGSICPAQQTDPTRADYAYRPTIEALVERVKSRLPAN